MRQSDSAQSDSTRNALIAQRKAVREQLISNQPEGHGGATLGGTDGGVSTGGGRRGGRTGGAGLRAPSLSARPCQCGFLAFGKNGEHRDILRRAGGRR